MVKILLKSMLALGLSLAPYIRADEMVSDNSQIAQVPEEVMELVKGLSVKDEHACLKHLQELVNVGEDVISCPEAMMAIEQAMKYADQEGLEVLAQYKSELENGDLVCSMDEYRRRRKCGTFCRLRVSQCLTAGCAKIGGNLCVGGNETVCGSVTASNFIFSGTCASCVCPGVTVPVNISNLPTFTIPQNVAVGGDITFNNCGTNVLEAQGACASLLRNLIGRSTLAGTLGTFASAGPGTVITFASVPTSTLTATCGLQPAAPAVTATGFSSGIVAPSASGTAGFIFDFAINLALPITFTSAYTAAPILETTLETAAPVVGADQVHTTVVNATTSTVIQSYVSNVSSAGATLNFLFMIQVFGAGGDIPTAYAAALVNAQGAINGILAATLSMDVYANGKVV